MSLWPFRYFVLEWKKMSAPCSNGLWNTGVANVLSTMSSAPAWWAISAAAPRSMSRISGFVGVSTMIARVADVTASAMRWGSRQST